MSEEQRWMPIETAPKDGTEVQIWGDEGWTPKARFSGKKGYWCEEYWDADWASYCESSVYGVTHWMPLPSPPTKEPNHV